MEKQLRCKDCKWYTLWRMRGYCDRVHGINKRVNPGQFACKWFVYKDK